MCTRHMQAQKSLIKESNLLTIDDEGESPLAPGQGETILEGDIPEGEEPSVAASDVYVVMLVGQGEGGTYTLRGVYSSREKAESAIENSDYSGYFGGGSLEMRRMQLDSSEQIEAF